MFFLKCCTKIQENKWFFDLMIEISRKHGFLFELLHENPRKTSGFWDLMIEIPRKQSFFF